MKYTFTFTLNPTWLCREGGYDVPAFLGHFRFLKIFGKRRKQRWLRLGVAMLVRTGRIVLLDSHLVLCFILQPFHVHIYIGEHPN
jgi:hypothetical protein